MKSIRIVDENTGELILEKEIAGDFQLQWTERTDSGHIHRIGRIENGRFDDIVEKEQIYKAALNKWGPNLQIIMMFEEMAELQKELSKNLRGTENSTSIAEEIADVEIMLEQMKGLFEIESQVLKFKEYKLKRLKEILSK